MRLRCCGVRRVGEAQFTWHLGDRVADLRYLIRDRAGQFADAFDAVFAAEGIEVLRSAPKARGSTPTPNASYGRWSGRGGHHPDGAKFKPTQNQPEGNVKGVISGLRCRASATT